MKTIHKYRLKIVDYQSIETHIGAEIISVGEQDGNLCVWAMVDTKKPSVEKKIWVIGTGNYCAPSVEGFVGTVAIGPHVWHVFQDYLDKFRN